METFILTLGERTIDHFTSVPPLELALEAVLFFVIYLTFDIAYLLISMHIVALKGKPFSRAVGGKKRILIAGDSTAVGTGARDQYHTLAGYFAQDFPGVDIENVAKNGSYIKDVASQLERAEGDTYDMIMISTGGNDVWAFTKAKSIRKNLTEILKKAKEMSNHRVILIFFGNEGSAPFFPKPLRKILMRRTQKINKILIDVASEARVPLIELFTTVEGNPFVRNSKKYFALDGLHPNDEGYWFWYKIIWRRIVKEGYFFASDRSLKGEK